MSDRSNEGANAYRSGAGDDATENAALPPQNELDDQESLIEAFWVDARMRAKLNPAPSYMGVGALESLRPPAWAFGSDPKTADELLGLVLEGVKTATSSPAWDYDEPGEEYPERGNLGILLDGRGAPRALVETTHVEIVPFDEVGPEHAYAEGEGDRSLEYWRREHRSVFSSSARGFSEDMPVVCERFRLLVPKPARGGGAAGPTG